MYHSMQVRLDKRFSNGLQFRFAYTFSNLMNNGAETGISESLDAPQSVYRRGWSLSNDNVAHAVIIAYSYELPIGKGKPFGNGWQIPPAGRLGNSSRTDPVIRGWASYTEDVSLFKNFGIKESLRLRTGANFSNLFNRHEWCNPTTNLTDTVNFGLVTGQCDVSRRIEVYMRFQF